MLNEQEQALALDLARQSVKNGLDTGSPLLPDLNNYPDVFNDIKACFVTLNIDGNLRGCIGSLTATRKLGLDIADNAFAAAFRDPRFPQLNKQEYDKLDFHISILSDVTPFEVKDEADLLVRLRPGVDGLVLSDRGYRATFLPSVWEQLPQAEEFINHLKLKAGLAANHWSDTIQFEKYTVQEFGDHHT